MGSKGDSDDNALAEKITRPAIHIIRRGSSDRFVLTGHVFVTDAASVFASGDWLKTEKVSVHTSGHRHNDAAVASPSLELRVALRTRVAHALYSCWAVLNA